MPPDHTPPSSDAPKVVAGTALALALTAYGILAKRRVAARPAPQEPPPAGSTAIAAKRDWLGLSVRVARSAFEKQLLFVAAGVAFYGFLAIPATLAVLASLSLLIWDSGAVQRGVQPVAHMIPAYVMKLLSDPHSLQTLGIGLLVTLIIDLWSALSGSACMLDALKLVHGERRKRGFIKRQMNVLLLSALTIPFVFGSLLLILVLLAVIDLLPLSPLAKTTISVVQWLILVVLFMTMLAAVYSYAPHRAEQHWQWVSSGAVVAMIVWIAVSAGLSIFATEFVPYDRSYGELGLIMGLLMWLYFTAFTILLGAQIDAEIGQDHRTG